MSNTIHRKAPIRSKPYVKKQETTKTSQNFGIEDITPDINLIPISNSSLNTFDGFFEEKPKHPSLTYELSSAYAKKFIESSPYLWGSGSSPSLKKTMHEIMEEFEELVDNQESIENFEQKKQILQTVNQELFSELENRETIQNNMLASNMMSIGS